MRGKLWPIGWHAVACLATTRRSGGQGVSRQLVEVPAWRSPRRG
ncbi:hypothetical protein [Streptosporangium canum]